MHFPCFFLIRKILVSGLIMGMMLRELIEKLLEEVKCFHLVKIKKQLRSLVLVVGNRRAMSVDNPLSGLSPGEMGEILRGLSSEDILPIEIDNVVYEIPVPVYLLIDNLVNQIKHISEIDGLQIN